VLIQAATKHEHLALVTGLYLAFYSVGSAFGNTVSGAIWTQTLPAKLNTQLAAVTTNASVAITAYGDPFTFVSEYSVGTPERTVVIDAYRSTQRLLCVCGICLCALLVMFAMVLRNPRLGKEQSLPDAEVGERAGDLSSRSKHSSDGDRI
jgi:SIT family siderophore-iron:H+ symporter-like MFS transporter